MRVTSLSSTAEGDVCRITELSPIDSGARPDIERFEEHISGERRCRAVPEWNDITEDSESSDPGSRRNHVYADDHSSEHSKRTSDDDVEGSEDDSGTPFYK
jgi:hypothetical protein